MSRFARRLQRSKLYTNTIVVPPGSPTDPLAYPTYTNYAVVDYDDLWAEVMATKSVSERTPMSGPGSNVGHVLA